jgi:hypothetical protein
MLHRRTLAAGALLLALPLSSCGFDNATEQPYQASTGADHRQGTVDVLNAVVVSGEAGSGTFIATFANTDIEVDDQVTALSGSTADGSSLEVGNFAPIQVPADGLVSLADDVAAAPTVTGAFTSGEWVEVKITFAEDEAAEFRIPVVPNSGIFAGLDSTSEVQTETQPAEGPSESPHSHSESTDSH